MLSGVGPQSELERAGVACRLDSPHVGKHLKDHLQIPLFFLDLAAAVTMDDVAASIPEWQQTGQGIASSPLYDAAAFFSTGLGDRHTHDAAIACIPCGYDATTWTNRVNLDVGRYFDSVSTRLASNKKEHHLAAYAGAAAQQGRDHAEERRLWRASRDPYELLFGPARHEGHDGRNPSERWRSRRNGRGSRTSARGGPRPSWRKNIDTTVAKPSEALLEDLASYFSLTVWHPSCTCRIGGVVDPRLKVAGVEQLRVADASVMPNIVSGNTNAASIMIGERAAELIAIDHGVKLAEFVDVSVNSAMAQDARGQ